MTYVAAATAFAREYAGEEDTSTGLNNFLFARAAGVLGDVTEARRFFYIGTLRVVSTGDLYVPAGLPGIRIRQLTAEGGYSFVVDTARLPPVLLTNFDAADDLVDLIGPNNARVLAAMRKVWNERMRETQFYTTWQIDRAVALIDAGVLVYPTSAKMIAATNPSLPLHLVEPVLETDEARAAWESVCGVFREIALEYDKKALELAAAATEAANADAAFWDGVYTAVKAVRDAPLTAVALAGEGVGYLFVTNWRFFALLGLIGLAYLYRGKLAAIAKGAGKSVLAKTGGAL